MPPSSGPCLLFATILMLLVAAAGCGENAPSYDGPTTLFFGPKFWTGDPERPWVAGVLVSKGEIVQLLDRAELGRAASLGGTIRQLPGAVAVPGLVDAHAHIYSYGKTLRRARLAGARSVDEALERVVEFAESHPDDAWVLGRGWDQNDWSGAGWPDADRLEQAVPGRPVALSRIDGHALWVNRTALSAAGIGRETPDPPGGAIHRDANGRATGILIDRAAELVEAVYPPPSTEAIEQALEQAARDLMAVGLCGVHDMGLGNARTGTDRQVWEAMQRLAAQGRFPLRVFGYPQRESEIYRDLLQTGPTGEGRLELIGVKIYADGALGSRGARLLEPYSDEPESSGLWVTPPEEVKQTIIEALAAGLQPAVHAIGDAACSIVLDAAEQAAAANPDGLPVPIRLEHAQIVTLADIDRLGALGVIASMQPTHATSDMPWAIDRLGEQRLAGAYAWQRMLDVGAVLALGSDFPVESIDPRLGLYAAVTRQDLAGQPAGGWYPDQRLTVEQAVAGFTCGAAAAIGRQQTLGRLAPGQLCDLTIFGKNPLQSAPAKLPTVPVVGVVIGGELYPAGWSGPVATETE